MGRWEPDAAGRLRRAALDLFAERGYEQTTVADIAGRAGVTERTFFRHFADKREVLFDGTDALRDGVLAALAAAPASMPPFEATVEAVAASGEVLEERRPFARQRAQVIASHADLRERELLKLAALGDSLADGLRHRGVSETAARLLAETGVAVFRAGFERWVGDAADAPLAACVREAAAQLRRAAAGA